jgi:hypothetical protein
MGGLSNKIVGSQHHGSVGLGLLLEELTRCSLFNYFAQPHKLIYALIWLHVMPTFKIVHRGGTDCAQNYFTLIEHRELNDRPIEVPGPRLAAAALRMLHSGGISMSQVDRSMSASLRSRSRIAVMALAPSRAKTPPRPEYEAIAPPWEP